jgi:hypothetical protein
MKKDDQAFAENMTFRLRAMAKIKERKRMCIKGVVTVVVARMDF